MPTVVAQPHSVTGNDVGTTALLTIHAVREACLSSTMTHHKTISVLMSHVAGAIG